MNNSTLDKNETIKNKKLLSDLPNPLYLNLGCGTDIRENFVNIDINIFHPNVLNIDVRKLPFQDNTVDLILASDIIEHFSHREIDNIFIEWARTLKPKGLLIIRCPSLKLQTKAYLNNIWNADIASYMIFGSQKTEMDYNHIAFDDNSIKQHLKKAGLQVIELKEVDLPQTQGFINLNMIVKAIKTTDNESVKLEKNETELPKNIYHVSNVQISINDNIKTIPKKINIIYEGNLFGNNSLSKINREICLEFIKNKNINTIILSDIPKIDYNNYEFKLLKENNIRFKNNLYNEDDNTPCIWINYQNKYHNVEGIKWIANYCYNNSFNPDIEKEKTLNKADEIWINSNFTKNNLLKIGIEEEKIKYIPIGINHIKFNPNGNSYNLNNSKKLKFLFIGEPTINSGLDILLQSYIKTFNKQDNVCLVIKSIEAQDNKTEQIINKILELKENKNSPDIIYFDSNEIIEENLYRTCNVLICPKKNNYSPYTIDAMACGLPLITIDNIDDIIMDKNILKYGIISTNILSDNDINKLSNILNSIYDNSEILFSKGIINSAYIRQNLTLDKAKEQFFYLINNLLENNTTENTQNTENKQINIENTDDICIQLGQAEILYNSKDIKQAKILYDNVLKNNLIIKLKIHCINRLAQIAIRENDFKLVKKYIDDIDNLQQNNLDVLWIKMMLMKIEKKYEKALNYISILIKNIEDKNYISTISINYIDCLIQKANIYFLMQKYTKALETYTFILSINNNIAIAYYGIGLCYQKANLTKKAKDMFNIAEKYGFKI